MKPATIITVTNAKGGVGKTTTTGNLAWKLSSMGLKVLIIDGDAQGDASFSMGMDKLDRVYPMLEATKVDGRAIMTNYPTSYILGTGKESIDIVCGGPRTPVIEHTHKAFQISLPESVRIIRTASMNHDVVIIDTPPAGYIQDIAILAADVVVIPTVLSSFDIANTEQIIARVEAMAKQAGRDNPRQIILPVMVECNTVEGKEQHSYLETHDRYGSMLAQRVPKSVDVRVAQAEQMTVFEYAAVSAKNDKATKGVQFAYSELAQQVMDAAVRGADDAKI